MKDFFAKNKIPIAIIIATFIITGLVRLSNKPTPTMARNERERTPAPQQPPEPEQPPVKHINYIEAPKHMGEYACVVGKIVQVHTTRGNNTYLNFCSGYITCPFGAVIFKPNAFKFPLPKRFEGKTVEITGLITTYQGQARIILNDSNQIKISKREGTAELEQPPAKRINYTEGPNHVGEYACVVGKIDHVRTARGNNTYLNFCPGYRTCLFGAIIFKPDTFKFPLPKRFEGKTVEITGLIATYRGQAYIILNNPSQIKYTSRSSL